MDGFPLTFTEAVCLGASLSLTGICYYLYRKSRKTLDQLDDAPHFNIDSKLGDILKATPGACLQYAVIEGPVQPIGEPLKSHFHKDLVGVLQKFKLTEHRLVWNGLSRTWTDSERVLHQRVNSVAFLISGPDETTVRILNPLQALGHYMEITYEKFHQVTYGLGDIVGQYLSGEKLKGQLETEEMLKVGANLTCVGELILDTDGTLNLRPPSNGSLYFLSTTDFDTLRGEQESSAVLWKVLAIISALAGAAVLLWVGRRYYHQLKVRWEQEQERREFDRLRAEAPRARASAASPDQDEEENLENACVICLTRPRNCILLDCGHACCCHNCYLALPHRRCPICRQHIIRVVPLYHV
ncbi:mitochondrial ubiquitin ligase activator of nfkb 1-A [Cheilinus undulatus]|uniref:mitochondrial ubiquitin ligase activator of nfkb 1-A n=1 Tax=Cheilinus undulatus TaxID=241271 RepID=UPI001BD625C2|nr:mitochondrial ubiquitin ligase activator of nfkb 1-A [Cheilinus undulatus]XP_041660307.1 mitochondrial ubiquitin ligase activator of nfkb 1-A [Cheilinus undulatus]